MDFVKTAVVTGATSGLGKEIAIYLLTADWKVYLLGRSVEDLKEEEPFTEYFKNRQAVGCKSDFLNDSETLKAVSRIIKAEKSLGLLIHSAAYYTAGNVSEGDLSDLDKSYQINVKAPFMLTQKLVPSLSKGKGAVIFLNSSSINGRVNENLVAYTATKSALKSMADSLRKEVNTKGIRVTTVYLGKTDTPMQKKASNLFDYDYKADRMMNPTSVAKIICDTALSPREIECTDLYLRPSMPY